MLENCQRCPKAQSLILMSLLRLTNSPKDIFAWYMTYTITKLDNFHWMIQLTNQLINSPIISAWMENEGLGLEILNSKV